MEIPKRHTSAQMEHTWNVPCHMDGVVNATSTCGQDQRGEGAMLHIEDMLFICSPLLTFVSSVAGISGGCTICWCMGVGDSDIKEV